MLTTSRKRVVNDKSRSIVSARGTLTLPFPSFAFNLFRLGNYYFNQTHSARRGQSSQRGARGRAARTPDERAAQGAVRTRANQPAARKTERGICASARD